MPILVICYAKIEILIPEIKKFASIMNFSFELDYRSGEYKGLMKFLTQSGMNLLDIILKEQVDYDETNKEILEIYNAKTDYLFAMFNKCREIVINNEPGCNILRYLLYCMNNDIINKQIGNNNDKLSGLKLKFGCLPFDKMPLCTSLIDHNPRLIDLLDCIDYSDRTHELLARYIKMNTENNGQIYTPKKELTKFGDINKLINLYNSKLYNNSNHK